MNVTFVRSSLDEGVLIVVLKVPQLMFTVLVLMGEGQVPA